MWSGEALGETPFTSIQSKNMEFGEILAGAHSVINALPLSQAGSTHARGRAHTHTHSIDFIMIFTALVQGLSGGGDWPVFHACHSEVGQLWLTRHFRTPLHHGGAGFACRLPFAGSERTNGAASEAEAVAFHLCGLCEMESFACVNSWSAPSRKICLLRNADKLESFQSDRVYEVMDAIWTDLVPRIKKQSQSFHPLYLFIFLHTPKILHWNVKCWWYTETFNHWKS